MMTEDDEHQPFLAAVRAAGHHLIRDGEGAIDWYAYDFDMCYGPCCGVCKTCWCVHCEERDARFNKGIFTIDPCTSQGATLP